MRYVDQMTANPPPDMPPAIPAATLVIFREQRPGPPELLFVERAASMAFAGGALVFPGGRIDPGDHDLAARLLTNPAVDRDVAARIAAIRETIEEVGLAIGLTPLPTEPELRILRDALGSGRSLADAIDMAGTAIDPMALEYFARWRPAHAHARIFDTRFYLVRLPAEMPDPVVDGTENSRLLWATAQQILDDADAGRAQIIFPTRRNLERLARFADFDAAVADARRHPVRTVTPWSETHEGEAYLCIPDDLGYPVTRERLSSAVRG